MMTPRMILAAAAVVALASLAPTAQASPNDVTVGALRTPTERKGAPLRAEPAMGARVLGNVAHGTRFHVAEVQGKWIRVNAPVTGGASQSGWLKAADTVEPFALTGSGREISTGTGPRNAGGDVSAAARGFGPSIEKDAMASDAQLRAAMSLVDAVEAAKPTPEEISIFSKQGRLGIPGKIR
jgi:hypothetical protein